MKKIKCIIFTMIIFMCLCIEWCYAIEDLNQTQTDFKVRFSGRPTVSDANKVKAAITNDICATINVSNLTMDESIETVTYIVQNTSKDLFAELYINTTNSNEEYFLVETEIEKDTLINGEATKVIVKVELIKEPVGETEKATIGIQLDAKPVQPTEDNSQKQEPNGSSSSSSSSNQSSASNPSSTTTTNKNYGYYEKDETPKTGIFKLIDILGR